MTTGTSVNLPSLLARLQARLAEPAGIDLLLTDDLDDYTTGEDVGPAVRSLPDSLLLQTGLRLRALPWLYMGGCRIPVPWLGNGWLAKPFHDWELIFAAGVTLGRALEHLSEEARGAGCTLDWSDGTCVVTGPPSLDLPSFVGPPELLARLLQRWKHGQDTLKPPDR